MSYLQAVTTFLFILVWITISLVLADKILSRFYLHDSKYFISIMGLIVALIILSSSFIIYVGANL